MVTIIGGGIAGSALAGALARRDRPVSLFEQRRDGGGGAFLFIDGRGHDALFELGVDRDALYAASYPVNGLGYADSAGRRSSRTDRGHRFWLRHALMEILTEFVGDSGAQPHYGHPIEDVTLAEGGTILHRGGAAITVDDHLIVATDGIDSVVRSRLEPQRSPEYAGDVVLYGRTTEPVEADGEPAVLHFFAEIAPDGGSISTFGHIWRPDDIAYWFIRIARPPLTAADDLGTRPMDEWADTVLAAAPSSRKLVGDLISRTAAVHVSNARNVPLVGAAEPALPVVLVGDADHAITPAAGVGARDALEDARAVYQAVLAKASPAAAMAERRAEILAERERVQRVRRQSIR
ncbi:NAD(P)-binding protein [Nocardia sp. CDC159]|uniref:NAD(P)-binding protein n=1 Tax=Nocardia pulmonis TaxID=2951408 RepID=A0A9X2E6M8_9NOCA|nr:MULTISPECIES: NAD(P)-binding protein [Nocardia]MCM6775097.1 NAD(P)-binding protein [Nocardia pulmonis]MCM6789567.1 NAD(P)-binding protein [Nocardia sp. CDC159]